MVLFLFSVVACNNDDAKDPNVDDGDLIDDTDTAADTDDSDDPDDSGEPDDTGNGNGDSGGETGEDTGVSDPDTEDTIPIDTAPPDTGAGPDPLPDTLVAQPKWNKMVGPSDRAFRLDGRGSYDPEGSALTYWWDATNGTFDDPTSSTPWYSGGTGIVELTVSDDEGAGLPITMSVTADAPAARIPEDYADPDLAILAGETVLLLAAGTYGPISGAVTIIGDPEGGVIIDAEGEPYAVEGASYLRHLTITGASESGVYAPSDIRIHDVVIEGNGSTDTNGGGIWSNAVVILFDSVVQDNTGNLGGGIYLERNASLYAQQIVIADNYAEYGGGIYTNTTFGNVTLYNGLLVGNEAHINGGGGTFLDSRAFFTRVTIGDNVNGGIRLRWGYFEVAESLFAFNSVYGIDEADAPTVHIYDSTFGTTDIVSGGLAPDILDGNITGDAVFTTFTSGASWTSQDFRLRATSPGYDLLPDGQDRDGTDQDAGAYGGHLGRFPAGTQGTWD